MNYSINKTFVILGMAFMLALGMGVAVAPSHAEAYYYNTPIYSYTYPSLPATQPSVSPLQAQCYPMNLNVTTGNTVTWYASAYGGNGSFYYVWTGTDGLSGQGQSIPMTYYTAGYKMASITVTSGGQTVSANCTGSVNVTGSNTYYNPTYPVIPTTYYSPLSVTCNAGNSFTSGNNSAVTWTAYASGGNGGYSYSWTGTDGLSGSGQSVYYTYTNPGMKYAYVTAYSNGQSVTQACASGVNILGYGNGYGYGTSYNTSYNTTYGTTYQPVAYNSSGNQGLDIGCYSDPATISINQPITWSTEVTGGVAPYTYSWTGSDGLTGSSASVIKTYSASGEKSAIVTVTSADGKTGSRSCTNTLAVRGSGYGSNIASNATRTTVASNSTTNTNNGGLSAASALSLGSIPWGWVAVLIILVLFATVLYLIFNKPKI